MWDFGLNYLLICYWCVVIDSETDSKTNTNYYYIRYSNIFTFRDDWFDFEEVVSYERMKRKFVNKL